MCATIGSRSGAVLSKPATEDDANPSAASRSSVIIWLIRLKLWPSQPLLARRSPVTYIHDFEEVTLLDRPGVDSRNESLEVSYEVEQMIRKLTSRSGTLLAQLLNAPPKVGLAMISSTASRLASAQSLSNAISSSPVVNSLRFSEWTF